MGMAAILFNDSEPFEQIDNMLSTEGSKCNLNKTGQGVTEKKKFKDYEILYLYIAQGQGRITDFIHLFSPGARADNPAGQNFDCN